MFDMDDKQLRNDFSESLDASTPASYEKDDAASISSREIVSQYFGTKIRNSNVDIVVLLCCFVTGLLDGTVFNAYRTFVSMQTGNTMFLGLGASNYNTTTRPYGWAKSLCSILFFVLGCYAFPRFSRYCGSLRRGTLVISFLMQATLIFISAILVHTNTVEGRLEKIGDEMDWMHLIPIALLSIQAPGQTSLTRDLGLPEVPTLVVTTMTYDFASDPRLFASMKKNPARNRRFLGYVMILVGAVAGGWISKKSGHITISLWTTAAVKFAIAAAWVIWPADARDTRRGIC